MAESFKPVRWIGSALDDIRQFPPEARRRAGHELELVQAGLPPTDQKPMSSVGTGVFEIRVRTPQQQHRVLYVAKFQEAIYVLHAFEK
jgi:phage-related protein